MTTAECQPCAARHVLSGVLPPRTLALKVKPVSGFIPLLKLRGAGWSLEVDIVGSASVRAGLLTVSFDPVSQEVTIRVFDTRGQLLFTFTDKTLIVGSNVQLGWVANDAKSTRHSVRRPRHGIGHLIAGNLSVGTSTEIPLRYFDIEAESHVIVSWNPFAPVEAESSVSITSTENLPRSLGELTYGVKLTFKWGVSGAPLRPSKYTQAEAVGVSLVKEFFPAIEREAAVGGVLVAFSGEVDDLFTLLEAA